MPRSLVAALALTTLLRGLQAGGTLFALLVVLPARVSLGTVAYAQFARVSDLGPGRLVDPVLGIGGMALTLATFGLSILLPAPKRVRILLGATLCFALLGGITTLMAAPTMWRVGDAPDDPAVLGPLLEQFYAWSTARTVLNQVAFVTVLVALVRR